MEFNATSHPLPENVALTKKVVALAAPRGVMVVGQVGQLEYDPPAETTETAAAGTTSPIEAKYYVERTGVDCLAVSVNRISSSGNKYEFTRLSKINQAAGVPLGIHGSAGLTDEQLRRMISFGAAKINYSTVLFDVAARKIRENALAGVEGYAATMAGVQDAVRLEAERIIRVWGSGGRGAEVLLQCKLAGVVPDNTAHGNDADEMNARKKVKSIFSNSSQ